MKRPVIGKRRFLAVVAGCLLPVAVALAWIALPLPGDITSRPDALSLSIEDRHGLLLRTTRAEDGSLARWMSLDELDPQLIQAFVAQEDQRFFSHSGVDLRAAARALVQDVRGARVVSGASTITMQLARLVRPSGRGVLGKGKQVFWAWRLERHLGKQEILEQYLNRVPLGQAAIGVPAAAALYFNASASSLSLGQAALLAGLASSPTAGNPFVSADRARERRAQALRRMQRRGYAGAEAAERAAAEPMNIARPRGVFLAPHFTTRLLAWAEDSAGAPQGSWRTSLNLGLQQELESEVRHTVTLLQDREVRDAAAVVLDNRTGEILAWVGSPDFWSDSAGQVDMVTSPRQPGSALKPFLYGLAFDHGVTTATVLPDIAHTWQTSTGPYQPRNYDRRYHGPVLAREALASSFNVPAVDLTDRLGAAALLRTLHAAGFRSLAQSADFYGLGLALGNGGVSLLELANGYRALANGGVWRPWHWQANLPGELPSHDGGPRVVSAGAAALVLDVLSDPVARIPGFGLDTPFDFPFPVAVKTGTSHHFTDNWAVGVTGNFTVAVWAGNFSGRPMRHISGVTGAGPLLHRALLDVAKRYSPGVLPSPAAAGAVRATVCRLSGRLAGEHCPGTDEWFLPGTVPLGECDWHQGGRVVWPAEYAEWAEQNGHVEVAAAAAAQDSARFHIVSPQDGDAYQVPPGVDPRYSTIALRVAATPDDHPVRWFVDGRPAAAERWQLQAGRHAFRAVGASGRSAEATILVR